MQKRTQIIIFSLVLTVFFDLKVAVSQPSLEVIGILNDDKGESRAIVNDKVVSVGDEINGAKVIEIRDDSVKFKYKNRIVVKRIGNDIAGDKEKQRKTLESYESKKTEMDLRMLGDEIEKREKKLEYENKSNDYKEAAFRYELAGDYTAAIDSLNKSIYYAEYVLSLENEESEKEKINSLIELREKWISELWNREDSEPN